MGSLAGSAIKKIMINILGFFLPFNNLYDGNSWNNSHVLHDSSILINNNTKSISLERDHALKCGKKYCKVAVQVQLTEGEVATHLTEGEVATHPWCIAFIFL